MPRRLRSTARMLCAVSLAAGAVAAAPATGDAQTAPLDTVSVSGGGGLFDSISVDAQSGTSGENASGSVRYRAAQTIVGGGPVTCVRVTGPDRGGGTASAPTTAVVNYRDSFFSGGISTLVIVDNGGNGADTVTLIGAPFQDRAASDCSTPAPDGFVVSPLTAGRAVVFDAPVLPTSKDQCKNGGWQSFGGRFRNQGQCVAFVERGPGPR